MIEKTAGTLLELATACAGDEAAIICALQSGYSLTGNFKGHESDVLASLEV